MARRSPSCCSTRHRFPAGVAPAQSAAEIAADQAAVDQAQSALDAVREQGSRVSQAQQVATDTSNQADQARSTAGTTDTYTLDSAVSTAQSAVDTAQSSIDYDTSRISTAQSSLDTDHQYGFDTTSDQQSLNDATTALTADKAKLADAKTALTTAQGKLDAATSSQQAAQRRADALASSAATLQQTASDLSTQQQARETTASDALAAAQQTQTTHRTAALATLAVWTHDHRVAVDGVRARNSVLADARRTAWWRAGSAGGLGLVVLGLAVTALVLYRRGRRPAPVLGVPDDSAPGRRHEAGVPALLGMLQERMPTPRRRRARRP